MRRRWPRFPYTALCSWQAHRKVHSRSTSAPRIRTPSFRERLPCPYRRRSCPISDEFSTEEKDGKLRATSILPLADGGQAGDATKGFERRFPYLMFSSGNSLRSLHRGLLICPGAGKDARHGIIALVTREFIDRLVAPRHRNLCRPRSRPGGRIVDGEFIKQGVGVGSREPFDQMRVCARSGKACLALEVIGFDDERIALPV